jgi:hypothetical protein
MKFLKNASNQSLKNTNHIKLKINKEKNQILIKYNIFIRLGDNNFIFFDIK